MKTTLPGGALALATLLSSSHALACACGCGVFDVGTSSLFPDSSGGKVYMSWSYVDQDKNYNGALRAAAADNPDQEIRTYFVTLGAQYMFNASWGLQVDLPGAARQFTTIDDSGMLTSANHLTLGDVQIRGIYTGFSADMSSGITLGLKLPTGDSSFAGFDPDTEIGTGSTDLLLGFYHQGYFVQDAPWNWFAQIQLDQPMLTQHGYIPGSEIDAGFGAYYTGLELGQDSRLAPMLQLLGTSKAADHGGNSAADPFNTGYQRILIAPSAEVAWGSWHLFTSVEFPVYEYFNGMQLAAGEMYKAVVSYKF